MDNKIKLRMFICLIGITLAILITYKISNPVILIPEPEFDEYPVSSSTYLIKQRKKIDDIVAKFNDSRLINKYISNYSILKASSSGNTIIVDYKDKKTEKKYVFVLVNDALTIDVSSSDFSVFDNIFKIMVEANQNRLGNVMDFSDYFMKVSNHDITTKAFAISVMDKDVFEYVIYIDKTIVLLNN